MSADRSLARQIEEAKKSRENRPKWLQETSGLPGNGGREQKETWSSAEKLSRAKR
jgi:hypothetical protein